MVSLWMNATENAILHIFFMNLSVPGAFWHITAEQVLSTNPTKMGEKQLDNQLIHYSIEYKLYTQSLAVTISLQLQLCL